MNSIHIFYCIIFFLLTSLNGKTQETLILQPDSTTGKDAFLNSIDSDINRGTHPDFAAIAWTNAGRPVIVRSLIDFDFSQLPMHARIISASLNLYGYDSPSNIGHSKRSGSNSAILKRVISEWEEHSVTWNSAPSTTDTNQVIIPESGGSNQNYSIDVTALVLDILEDPNGSYGFMLQLEVEEFYRSLLFASSDNPDINLHPQLEIIYEPFGPKDGDVYIECIDCGVIMKSANGTCWKLIVKDDGQVVSKSIDCPD